MLQQILLTYLILINAVSLLLMLADKHKARRKVWRIPENVLMGTAIFGGSIGAIAGMYLFRHKTRHPKFFVGLPIILAVQITVVFAFVMRIQH